MDNPQDTRPQGYTAAPSTPGASAYQDARSNEHPPYQQATAYDPTEQYHPYTLQNPNPPGLYYLPSQQNPGAPYHSPVSGNLGTYYQGTAQSPQNMYYATDPRNFGSVPGYAGHAVFPQVPGAQYVPQYGVVPQIHGTGTPQIIGDATHPAHMQMQGAPYRIAASQNQGALRYVDPQGVRASHHGITLRDTPATYYGSTTPQTSGVPMYTAPPYAQANAPQLSSSFQSVPGPGVFIFYRTQRLAFTTTSGKLLNPSSTKHICLIHDIHDDSDGHKSAWIVPITSGSRSGNGVIKRNSELKPNWWIPVQWITAAGPLDPPPDKCYTSAGYKRTRQPIRVQYTPPLDPYIPGGGRIPDPKPCYIWVGDIGEAIPWDIVIREYRLNFCYNIDSANIDIIHSEMRRWSSTYPAPKRDADKIPDRWGESYPPPPDE